MLGRAAYHQSYLLARLDALLFPSDAPLPTRETVLAAMLTLRRGGAHSRGTPLRAITRHLLGLFHGQPSARGLRRVLSDSRLLARNDVALLRRELASGHGPDAFEAAAAAS